MYFKSSLSYDELVERLEYNPDNGEFVWRNGRKAGYIKKDGYIYIKINGDSYVAHRLAFLYFYGRHAVSEIDHIDRVKTNNSIANLREVSHAENKQNMRECQLNNKVGFLGVSVQKNNSKNPFKAQIMSGKRKIHIGYFKTAFEARAAYLKAKKEMHI